MDFRMTRQPAKQILFLCAIAAVFMIAGNIYAQKVRLRGFINPNCTPMIASRPQWRYADLYADGNIAVQGTNGCKGVFIYDISDPAHPVLASWYNTPDNEIFLEAIVIGNRGYFGSALVNGVHIVDLTNPYAPVLLGVVDDTHGNGYKRVHEMVVTGNYLIETFNGSPNTIIKVINISNPANPVFVRDIIAQENIWVHAVHVRGNRLFTSGIGTSGDRGKTEIYDISNIETQAPVLLGFIQDNTSSNVENDRMMHSSWTSEDGNYLYSCREQPEFPGHFDAGDVRVYDIHNPALPMLVNKVTGAQLGINASTPHNPVVVGNRLYVSWYQAGLQVFDITDPVHPQKIGEYDTYADTFTPPVLRQGEKRAKFAPREVMCGNIFSIRNTAIDSSFQGNWAIYPFLGQDRILAGDMSTGLYILDTTGIAAPLENQVSDFDGDGKTDLSKYTPAGGTWQIENSSNGAVSSAAFGLSDDKLAAGDYDGDGKTDIAVWRPGSGVWYSLDSSSGVFHANQWGLSADIPVPGDYDADGKTDIAVWRPGSGVWYIVQSTLGVKILNWGSNGDKPLVGDYEGDGKADPTIYRNGSWYVLKSSSSLPIGAAFGLSSDRPLAGDFDGDGKSDFAVYRPSTGVWYVFKSSINNFTATAFGLSSDSPIPADYDGDGKTDIAIYRASEGNWHILGTTAGYSVRNFGSGADIPSPTSVIPQ